MSTKALQSLTLWPPLLPLDIAIGIDDTQTILDRHGIDDETWETLQNLPAFRQELVRVTKEVRETGVSFKRKAAYQAETYLEDLDHLMTNLDTPPTVKLDIFKTLAKLGELEPKDSKEGQGGNSGPTFALQININ
jgi:uncharacterized protein YutE (UPF0331/DUF86 family)